MNIVCIVNGVQRDFAEVKSFRKSEVHWFLLLLYGTWPITSRRGTMHPVIAAFWSSLPVRATNGLEIKKKRSKREK